MFYNRTFFYLTVRNEYCIHVSIMETKERTIAKVTTEKGDSLKFSFRFGGRVSSITLGKKICALYLMLMNISGDGYSEIGSFVNECLGKWKKDDCRGFSEYVTTQMIFEMLERDDFEQYMLIYSKLSKS